MPLLPGLGGIINVGGGAVGLNFSALPYLPVGRRGAVTAAANTAAATLGVTAQSIVDALPTLASLLPNDGCLLASSGGAVTVQGDPVGAIRRWNGTEFSAQSNVSQRPTSGATGMTLNGTQGMSFGNLSTWTQGEGTVVLEMIPVNINNSNLWAIGTSGDAGLHPRPSDNVLLDDFGSNTRPVHAGATPAKSFYSVRAAAGQQIVKWNALNSSQPATVSFSSAATLGLGFRSYAGILFALSLNATLYTTAQLAAIEQFCKAYYGLTY